MFPDNSDNTVIFNFGRGNVEGPRRYNGRPNNTTLTFNPAIAFTEAHEIGEPINLSTAPIDNESKDYSFLTTGYKPRDDGSDYMAYLTNL